MQNALTPDPTEFAGCALHVNIFTKSHIKKKETIAPNLFAPVAKYERTMSMHVNGSQVVARLVVHTMQLRCSVAFFKTASWLKLKTKSLRHDACLMLVKSTTLMTLAVAESFVLGALSAVHGTFT